MATTNYLDAWPTDVFAAASLKEPVDKLSASYFLKTEVNVRIPYAFLSILARQIQYGVPADVFNSANLEWMKYLDGQGLLRQPIQPVASNIIIFASQSSETLDLNVAGVVIRLVGETIYSIN